MKFKVGDRVICLYRSKIYGTICTITAVNRIDKLYDLYHSVEWGGHTTGGFAEDELRLCTPLDELL